MSSCHHCAAVGYCSEVCCAQAQTRYHWLECGQVQHLLRVRMPGVGLTPHSLTRLHSLFVCVCMRACVHACVRACVHACVCMEHICVLMNVLLWPHGVLMLAGQLDGVAWFEDTVSKLSHWAKRYYSLIVQFHSTWFLDHSFSLKNSSMWKEIVKMYKKEGCPWKVRIN